MKEQVSNCLQFRRYPVGIPEPQHIGLVFRGENFGTQLLQSGAYLLPVKRSDLNAEMCDAKGLSVFISHLFQCQMGIGKPEEDTTGCRVAVCLRALFLINIHASEISG